MNAFSLSHPDQADSHIPPDTPRVNWLSIVRTGASEPVTGTFVVNPAQSVPETLLAPLCGKPGCVRPNLHLGSESTVDAGVWIVGRREDPAGDAFRKTRMAFTAQGAVSVRLHALGERTCVIRASSAHHGVELTLPADFAGLLTTSSARGRAPSIPAGFSMLREANGEGRYFRGNWTLFQGQDEWNGTTVNIDAAGSIRVVFEMPDLPSPPASWMESHNAESAACFLVVAGSIALWRTVSRARRRSAEHRDAAPGPPRVCKSE